MKLIVNNLDFSRCNGTSDCKISTFSTALRSQGIDYKDSDIILDSNALRFDFQNLNSKGLAVNTVLGATTNLIEEFAKNTGIKVNYFTGLNDKEEFELMADYISKSKCIITKVERFGLYNLLNPRIFNNISSKRKLPCHTMMIYGVDTIKKKFLVYDLSTLEKKFHSVWLDADKVNQVRVCEFLDLSINKDWCVIEDVSDYSKPDCELMLKMQIDRLKSSIENSLEPLKKFVNYINDIDINDSKSMRYLELQTWVLLTTTCGFDKSKFFYRNLFYDSFKEYYKGKDKENLLILLKEVSDNWYKFCYDFIEYRNNYTQYDLVKIWSRLITEANRELAFCNEFISSVV
jgi:hypothetical protein